MLTHNERRLLASRHTKRFKARLKLTLRSRSGRLIGTKTTRITVRVHA